MIERKINVLVTAIGGNGVGYQLLKAIKLAKLTSYRIFGSDIKKNAYQFDTVDNRVLLPSANSPDYISSLIEQCKINMIDVILPGSEAELKVLSDNKYILESEGLFLPITSAEVLDICFDKWKTNEFLNKNGFDYPKTKIITGQDEYIDFFPVVIKPATGGSGSQGVYLAQNKSQLNAVLKYLSEFDAQQNFIVQEYVGTPENEFTVGVLSDMSGVYVNSIVVNRDLSGLLSQKIREKNISGKPLLGSELVVSSGVSVGKVDSFPNIANVCVSVAKKLKATGSINIQCRLHEDKVYIFEINPRFSGTSSFRAMVGFNEADILIRQHFFGEAPIVDFEYEYATITRTLEEHFVPKD